MSVPSIVITGANSYLGRIAVEFLREKTAHRLVAVVSPRAELPAENERVRYLRADNSARAETTATKRCAVFSRRNSTARRPRYELAPVTTMLGTLIKSAEE